MNNQPTSTEEKIIFAAIDCIEKFGISGTTNRRIAEAAGVNNAAINYYFRSKDTLIERCMEITLKNAFDLSDMPVDPEKSAQEHCVDILMELITGGFQYPGITRSYFYNLFAEGQYDSQLTHAVNTFVEALAADLKNRDCTLPLHQIKEALAQILSVVFLIILAPQLFSQSQAIDYHDTAACKDYINRLVARLLSQ